MKDLGEASFVLGIEILQDRIKRVLGLSQKAYLENILKKSSTHASKPTLASIVKGEVVLGNSNILGTSTRSTK
jgi:hypothetical protein